MKKATLTLTLLVFALIGFSQYNFVNLTGGYAFLDADDSEYFDEEQNITATEWRINGTYDYNPNKGKIAYVTNSYYWNGLMQSASVGIGVRF